MESTTQGDILIEPIPADNPKCQNRTYAASGEDQSMAEEGYPASAIIEYDPWEQTSVTGDERDPRVGLAHEALSHGYDFVKGDVESREDEANREIPLNEIKGVNIENLVRAKTGDPIKYNYGGKVIPEELFVDPILKEVENANGN